MADFDKMTDDLADKAALATGVNAAKRALQDALLSDEERAARKVELERTSKSRRNKLIAYGVIAVLLVVGVVGLALTYWYLFLLAGLLGVGAIYARGRLRARRAGRAATASERAADATASEARAALAARPARAAPEPSASTKAMARGEPTALANAPEPDASRDEDGRALAQTQAQVDAAAAEDADAVEAELAALKARLRR